MRSDPQAARYDREAWAQRANAVRERLSVSMVVGRVVALKKAGPELVGLCPFHAEKTPSFTVNDRKGFYHCFGCGEHGDAIAFVMRRQGHAFPQAVELLEAEGGLRHLQAARPNPPAPQTEQREDRDKAAKVARIWERAQPLTVDGPVDRYLRGRGLLPPAEYGFPDPAGSAGWPSTVRYAPELWHGLEKRGLPAMVSAMRRPDGTLGAVHRTYLKITGVGVTKAGTERDKAMFGDPKGTWILLAPIAPAMVGAEGIETGFSAMQLFRRAGLAFGARAGMAATEPPFECSDFLYAADRNKSHPDPKRSRVGERAAWSGAKAFGVGRKVAVKVPALAGTDTCDFNDVLVEKLRIAALPSPFARALASQKARGIDPGAPINVIKEELPA
jgi:DNA primase